MKKLICLDTETTGFSAQHDRIIEIGCVHITLGIDKTTSFQRYINPLRSIHESAIKIHGLTADFLAQFKSIEHHLQEFLDFIEDSTLIIHNANFDISFLNAELTRHGFPELKNEVIDTLKIAKQKFPGQKVSLDALKNRFNLNIAREKHGALLDAEILAHIYVALLTEQTNLEIDKTPIANNHVALSNFMIPVSSDETKMHQQLVKAL